MKSKFRFVSLLSWLGKYKQASRPRLLARLLRDEEGSYLLIMTAAMPVFIGFAALATEGGLLFYNHRTLQSAADAAAYSAAIAYSYDPSADITTQAKAIVASYGFTLGTSNNEVNVPTPNIITNYAGSGNKAIQVSISRPQYAIFSRFYGFSALSNSVSATAVIAGSGGSSNGGGNCIFALGNSSSSPPANAQNAIQLQGNAAINAPGCGIFTNSNDCAAGAYSESLGGSASITAGSLGSAGCVNIFGNAQVHLPGGVTCNSGNSTACTQQDGALSDPFAGTTLPSSPSTCTSTGLSVTSSTTLQPGRYCQFLNLGQGSTINVTLCPGVYIFDSRGDSSTTFNVRHTNLTVAANGAASGCTGSSSTKGVTLVFTCSTCASSASPPWPSTMMAVDSNSTLGTAANPLSALNSGSTAGFLMLGDTHMHLNTVFDTHSNPTECLTGTIYVPNASFSWGGTPAASCPSTTCFQLIANMISLFGNPVFGGTGCTVDQSAGSGGRQVPIGSVVTLVN